VPTAKSLPDLTNHICRRSCTKKVTPADMQEFHAKFWALGDHTAQNAFLVRLVLLYRKRIATECMKDAKAKESLKIT